MPVDITSRNADTIPALLVKTFAFKFCPENLSVFLVKLPKHKM